MSPDPIEITNGYYDEGRFDFIMGNKYNPPVDEPYRTFYSEGWQLERDIKHV